MSLDNAFHEVRSGTSACGLVIAILLAIPIPLSAQTLYVDDDDPGACPCLHPARNDDPSCGTRDQPFECLRDAVATDLPFDTVIVRDGNYAECLSISKSGTGDAGRVTVAAENLRGASIACPSAQRPAVQITASYVTFRGFRVTGGSTGISIRGADVGRNDMGAGNALEDVEISRNQGGVILQRNCSDTRLTRLEIHDSDPFDGVKLDTYAAGTYIRDTVIEDSHIHHNAGNGIAEGSAERTVIRHCEIDSNGKDHNGHGLYLKGFEGIVQFNKIHHNAGYGLHLWAAPRGSVDRHYVAEGNEVFGNGGGVVVGGSPGEASPHVPLPPGDGMPHYVEVRYNTIHHNKGIGFNYLGFACSSTANGNSFHHNTVYKNRYQQIQIISAQGDSLLVKNNVVVGRPFFGSSILVSLANTNMAQDAMDGNIYYLPGTDPATAPGPFGWRCSRAASTTYYTLDQLRTRGIFQDNSCGADLSCGSSTALMEERSRWADPLVVDPSTSAWISAVGMSRGDFHLRRGSPAASGGVCCDASNGGVDLDGEAVPACSPAGCNASMAGLAVGADYPLDDDDDGIANRYECAPPDGTLCDGDGSPEAFENACLAEYPGAPYDPSVSPDNPEICDGKDDDCDAMTTTGGGESDEDGDGIFAPCGQDCDDADPGVFPGAPDTCDCKDNDCDGGIDEGCPDVDGDGINDACDICTDTDGDGFGNPGFSANTCPTDNRPNTYNPKQRGRKHDPGHSGGRLKHEEDLSGRGRRSQISPGA